MMNLVPPALTIKAIENAPAKSLYRYVWRMSGWHQIWLCVIAIVIAVLSMVPLELQRRIINRAIVDGDLRVLVTLGGAYLIVLIGQSVLKFVLRMYQSWVSESAVRYTRKRLSQIHDCRRATAGSDTGGQAVSIIGSEVEQIGGFVGEGLSEPVVHVATLLAILGYMTFLEPIIMIVGLALIIPQVLIALGIQRAINPLLEQRVDLLRRLAGLVASLGNRAVERDSSGDVNDIYANRMRILLLKFTGKVVMNLLNALAPLGALMVGGYLVIQGEATIGTVVAFLSGFERLSDPVRQLIAFYRVAAQANIHHRKIAQWM